MQAPAASSIQHSIVGVLGCSHSPRILEEAAAVESILHGAAQVWLMQVVVAVAPAAVESIIHGAGQVLLMQVVVAVAPHMQRILIVVEESKLTAAAIQ